MKILFIQPGLENTENCFPPIGLLYLASLSRGHGYDVDVYDASASGLSMSKAFEYAIENKPDICAVSLYTLDLIETLEFIKRVKDSIPHCICIVGGPHATALPEHTMKECEPIDYLVFGEGEQTLIELLNSIQNQSSHSGIKGICFRKDGEIIKNEPRPLIDNLDKIPFPAFDLITKNNYIRRSLSIGNKLGVIVSSRGCPFQCIFCFKGTFGRRYRQRSPQNIIKEMKWQIDEFGVDEFQFVDDLFTLDSQWLNDFFMELEKNDLHLPWKCAARVDSVTRDSLGQLKRHGCYGVEFGVESGNDEILKDIKKNITTSDVRKAFKDAREAGLLRFAFFIFGHPKDTHVTIKQTIKLAKEISPDYPAFALLLPFPGSEVYSSVLDEIKYDWSRFNSYYDKELLPLSLCQVDPYDLRNYARGAAWEVWGGLVFLLRNVILRPNILFQHRIQLLKLWQDGIKKRQRL